MLLADAGRRRPDAGGLETETGRRVASLGLGPLLPLRASVQGLEVCPGTVGKLGIYSFNGKSQAVEQKASENGKKLKQQKEETRAGRRAETECRMPEARGQRPEGGGMETETGRRVASLGLGPLLPLRASVQGLEVCPGTVGKLGIYSFNGKSQAVEQKAAERAEVGGLGAKRQKVETAKRRNGGRCRSGSEIGGLETETGEESPIWAWALCYLCELLFNPGGLFRHGRKTRYLLLQR